MRGGVSIALSPKALDLLFHLAARPGALVTKDEILAALWADVAVTDNALTQVVSEIRAALEDAAASPRFVETVPRRGYRFVADVHPVAAAVEHRPDPACATRSVSVSEFRNLSRDDATAWLGSALADTVANGLRVLRDLRVVDRPSSGGAAPAADVAIDGSFQRMGDRVRLAAHAVETRTGRAVAEVRADGALADIFALEDTIVDELRTAFRTGGSAAERVRVRPRETSSLEAYRALTEGRLELEALDRDRVPGATAAFERALALDPDYALAHVGLAHARFWIFQASRLTAHPDRQVLVEAIGHARRAVEIDPELAEGHAALALLLSAAGRPREATNAGRIAVALEPANWRHQFRLGIAAWGDERLNHLEAVTRVYPQLGYAHFGMAMVHVARGRLDRAEVVLRDGLRHERSAADDGRFPGSGSYWLLGLVRLAASDPTAAVEAFDDEIARSGRRGRNLFAEEFAMDAHDGHGFAHLATGKIDDAIAAFGRALALVPDHARSLVGLAAACARGGHMSRAREAAVGARRAIDTLRAQDRLVEVAMTSACADALRGEGERAVATLETLLTDAPPGFAGWTIPIEPCFTPLRRLPSFDAVLTHLAARAR